MKRGFSLVEIMVGITILLVMSTALLLSSSRFFASERIKEASSQLTANLNEARNLAITNQAPSGFVTKYIGVTLDNKGILSVYPGNAGVKGTAYFTRQISTGEIVTTPLVDGVLQFAMGSGKLVKTDATPQLSTFSVGVTLSSTEIADGIKEILISPFGTITIK